MNAADIAALCTGAAGIIGAVTALVVAVKGNASTRTLLAAHVTAGDHDVKPTGDM